MGVFTRLADLDVQGLADAFALGTVTSQAAIAAGTINSNFRIDTGPRRWFLRVNEGKSEDDVAWEAELVVGLAARGLPAPAPLAARDGRRYARGPDAKWVSVFEWRAGAHLAADQVTPDHAHRLGRALAKLHVIGLELPIERRRSIYDLDHLIVRFERFAASTDPALVPAISILAEELAMLRAAAPRRQAATTGIIHGDLFRDNVLWERGEIVAILDFEQASGGSLAYDLAVCLNDWCWTDQPRLDLAGALVTGYQAVRPIPEVDRSALLIEARAAAARFTITRITDVYLARVDNPDKDFRAFLARCEAWRGPALGQLSSLL